MKLKIGLTYLNNINELRTSCERTIWAWGKTKEKRKWTWCESWFFVGKCSQPGNQKKKRLENPTKGFMRLKKNNSPYLDKKTWKLPDLDIVFLKVARTRQDSKKDVLVHWTVAIYCQLMLRILANAPTWGISPKKNTDMNVLWKKK